MLATAAVSLLVAVGRTLNVGCLKVGLVRTASSALCSRVSSQILRMADISEEEWMVVGDRMGDRPHATNQVGPT